MKRLLLAALLLCSPAAAHEVEPVGLEFIGGYDYYRTPNSGNNYDDGQGFSIGAAHSITERLSGRAVFSHISDVHFPTVDDEKNSFGELRGYGGMYSLLFDLPFNDKLTFTLGGGVGYFVYDFKENPFLQRNNVVVELGNAIAYEAIVGVKYKVNESWDISISSGWWSTKMDKFASDGQREWHILDDSPLGLEFIPVRFEGRMEF